MGACGSSGNPTLPTAPGDRAPKILKVESAPCLTPPLRPALRQSKSASQLADSLSPSPTADLQERITRDDQRRVTFGGAECRNFRADLGGLC
mmetsp:Transcript_133403/g.333045  ORF Transcript_133403/g.333045 Transcript_133403/m.333045 type:complete len:92 (-) Transcript_133403:198-473(-)